MGKNSTHPIDQGIRTKLEMIDHAVRREITQDRTCKKSTGIKHMEKRRSIEMEAAQEGNSWN